MKDNSFIMLWNVYLQSCTFTFNVEHLILVSFFFCSFSVRWPQTRIQVSCFKHLIIKKLFPLLKGLIFNQRSTTVIHQEQKLSVMNWTDYTSIPAYAHMLHGVVEKHVKLHTNTNPQPLFHVTFPACTIRELQVPEAVFAPFRRCLK